MPDMLAHVRRRRRVACLAITEVGKGPMGIRILVVEDEAEIADFLVRGLREESFTVEHAGDGESAWHALRSGSWDLILLDWWLPTEDGLSLLHRFRTANRETPVL